MFPGSIISAGSGCSDFYSDSGCFAGSDYSYSESSADSGSCYSCLLPPRNICVLPQL